MIYYGGMLCLTRYDSFGIATHILFWYLAT